MRLSNSMQKHRGRNVVLCTFLPPTRHLSCSPHLNTSPSNISTAIARQRSWLPVLSIAMGVIVVSTNAGGSRCGRPQYLHGRLSLAGHYGGTGRPQRGRLGGGGPWQPEIRRGVVAPAPMQLAKRPGEDSAVAQAGPSTTSSVASAAAPMQ